MERVKKAAEVYKLYPKLRLTDEVKRPNGKPVHEPNGPHTVKITAEPTTTMVIREGVETKAFKFIVEEGGKLFKWTVPLTNKEGEGHYLIDRLQDIEVGEEIILEAKKRGARTYIDVRKVDADDEGEVPEEGEDI